MNWTTDKPTAPGWYWYKGPVLVDHNRKEIYNHQEPVILHVDKGSTGLEAEDAYPDYDRAYVGVNEMPGEWAGPIEAPK